MGLDWTIYLAFIGAGFAWLLGAKSPESARKTALITTLAILGVALAGALEHGASSELHTIRDIPWIAPIGARYFLAADGISTLLVLLAAVAGLTGVLFSWNITHRAAEYFALYLWLLGAVLGVFLSYDLLLFFVFYELAIVPKYFLIVIWGSTNRSYGAMKLALYSFIGSGMVLVVMVAAFVIAGAKSMVLPDLAGVAFSATAQNWLFIVSFVGFAILAGIWPFHTWAPTGHVAAPTAASMLLAGVIMKLGAYGCLRVSMTLFPEGLRYWQTGIALLAVVGIVYGAVVAMVQKDFKFVIGYSSVSHMGFVLLGLATFTVTGLSGAIMQMISHGIIAGLLFGVVGRMVYERTHTRDLDVLEGAALLKRLPFAAGAFSLAALASMGMPGFSGFVAELHVLIGAWDAFPGFAMLAGLGVVIGVAYSLRAVQKAFFGKETEAAAEMHDLAVPITVPERAGAMILLGCTVVLGLFPRLVLDPIVASFGSKLFDGLRKGGLL